jgi:hypothetical protein
MWAQRYLRWLGRERMAEIGYDFDDIRTRLVTPALRWRRVFGDVLGMCYGRYVVACEPWLFRKKRGLAKCGLGIDVLSE